MRYVNTKNLLNEFEVIRAESIFLSGLRVCIASDWYPYAYNPYHCAFVHEFAKRIKHAGAKVFIATLIQSPRDKKSDFMDGILVVRLRMRSRLYFNISLFLNLVRLFRKADLIHVHAITIFGSISTLLAKLLKKPVVVTVHRADVLPVNRLSLNLLRTVALKIANVVIAVSNATRSLVLRCGAPRNKVVVVYNTVDESVFAPRSVEVCRSELGIPQDSKVILSLGNLIPRKGFNYLVRALPALSKNISNVMLIVAGDGPQKGELISLVKDLKLENKVVFTGHIPTDKVILCYGAADVFALPSLHEGHCMVLLEAMASGLPVVATSVGGNIETVVDGKNGYLVPPRNVDSLTDTLTRILSNESLMKVLGKASLSIYKEKFSEGKQLHKISEIYWSLVSESK